MLTYKKRIGWIILFLIFHFVHLDLVAQYYPAHIYKDIPGMPSNRMLDILQAPTGELWFASSSGLVIYDGLSWKPVSDTIPFLPTSGKMKINLLPDSSIAVIGLRNSEYVMALYKNEVWSEVALPESFTSLSNQQAYFSYVSKKTGNLYLAYTNIIQIYDEKSQSWSDEIAAPISFPEDRIYCIVELEDRLLVGCINGMFEYRNSKFLKKSNESVFNLLHDTTGLYVLGSNWIGTYSGGSINKLITNETLKRTSNFASSVLLKKENQIIYALNSPMSTYDLSTGRNNTILTESFDADHSAINTIIDHENNIWSVTMRGIYKLISTQLQHFDKTQLVEDEVTAILETSDGRLFMGANTGFQIMDQKGNIHPYLLKNTKDQPRVMDIIEFEGTIYLAANSAGVVTHRNGSMENFTVEGYNNWADVHAYRDKIFASNNNQLYQLIDNEWVFLYESGFKSKSSYIRKIYFTDTYKFLLTPLGIYDVENNKTITSNNKNYSSVYDAIEIDDTLYLATNSGIAIYSNGKIEPFDDHGHNQWATFSFTKDHNNNVWAGTENGIYKPFDPNHIHISKENGLIGNEVNRNAFVTLKDGRLAIGTDEGVSFHNPEHEIEIPIPNSKISSIEVNQQPLINNELSASQNNLRFNFWAVSYFNESLINYRVKLEGLNEGWNNIPFSNQRSISYNNLDPGTYQFIVQARISEGEWGPEEKGPKLTIKAALFDTLWFRVTAILFIIISLYLFLRWWSNHLRWRNQQLEEKVAEKTSEINQKNLDLLKTIDDLKAMQGQLIQSEKLASMGLLTAGIAHEMNNPLNYIRGGAECLQKNLLELNDLYNSIKVGSNNGDNESYAFLIKESNQLLESILNGAKKSTHIIKSLGSFTADSQNFFSFVDLREEIETSLTLLNNRIGFRIQVTKHIGNVPKIECFPAKINQLLVNILLNATQAIEGNGKVTIRLYRKDEKLVGLDVQDDGVGIELSNPESVFEPFFTTKDNSPGLGLSIAKSIVQDHHGEITFQSAKGEGTIVKVLLPIYQTSHPELSEELKYKN